jgi:hypothetical protein
VEIPRFLFAPDQKEMQLYIVHTEFPLSIIYVEQTIPAKLFVVKTELVDDDESQDELAHDEREMLEEMLIAAGDWYRTAAPDSLNKN